MCYVVRLKHGDELRKCLLSFVKKNGLKAAFIMTCVGSATSARIRVASATANDEANYVCIINDCVLNNQIFQSKIRLNYHYHYKNPILTLSMSKYTYGMKYLSLIHI